MLLLSPFQIEKIKVSKLCQCYKITYGIDFFFFKTVTKVEIACKCKLGKQIVCCKISEDLLERIKNYFENPKMVLKYCNCYKVNCNNLIPTWPLIVT